MNFSYYIKWLLICLLIGLLSGSASALFLVSLNFVTALRVANTWLIFFLPLGGLLIGLTYYYHGKDVVAGNNLIIDEHKIPKKIIAFKMAPFVFVATLITHLFGGSAGREGTAVQMSTAIADQFTRLFKLNTTDRKTILTIGISAGFASVFGTPLAGAIFALEVLVIGKMRYESILPAFLTAIIANYTCTLWSVHHTHYTVPTVPQLNETNILWVILVGILFGLTALLFAKTVHFWNDLFAKKISYSPLRPVIGGSIITLLVWVTQAYDYIGLGIPTIANAFKEPSLEYDFILKLLFTTFTLGAGFKGGEVTPLFFVGATLGSALSVFIPLPVALLAAMGFVAVFSGATNTPIACTVMGMELFGSESGLYIALACVISYVCSGHTGIYKSQTVGALKRYF